MYQRYLRENLAWLDRWFTRATVNPCITFMNVARYTVSGLSLFWPSSSAVNLLQYIRSLILSSSSLPIQNIVEFHRSRLYRGIIRSICSRSLVQLIMFLPRFIPLLLLAISPFTIADVEFTSPAAGASVPGGTVITVQWKDSGDAPSISDLKSYQLFLCAGGNENPVG